MGIESVDSYKPEQSNERVEAAHLFKALADLGFRQEEWGVLYEIDECGIGKLQDLLFRIQDLAEKENAVANMHDAIEEMIVLYQKYPGEKRQSVNKADREVLQALRKRIFG